MIKKDNNSISSVYDETTVIGKIYKGIVKLYESWKKLLASGIPPLTLLKCKQANLVDYKIYGDSVQEGENLFNKTSIITDLYPNTTIFSTGTVWRGFVFECVPNTTYTLNKIAGQTCYLGTSTEYPANDVSINVKSNNPTGTNTSITTGENDKYVAAFFYRTNVDTVAYETILNSVEIKQVTPTPEAPIEIESVGDKTSNLFDKEYLSKTENYTINSGGGYFSASIKVKPNTTYTVFSKRTEATDTPERGFYCKVVLPTDAVGTVSSFAYYIESSDRFATNNKKTVTTGDDGLIYFAVSGNGSQSMLDILFKYYYFQIVEGTTKLEYEPYGYKIPVKVSGKNLYINKYSNYTQPLDYKICEITVKENTVYTLSTKLKDGKTALNSCTVGFATNGDRYSNFENFQITLGTSWLTPTKQITTTSNKIVLTVYADNEEIFNQLFDRYEIQLEEGSTATEFEPYVEPVTINMYSNEPLRKIGDYADYIDFEKQKVFRNVNELIITGDENWITTSQLENDTTLWFQMNDELSDAYKVNATSSSWLLSNRLETYNNYLETNTKNGICYHGINKKIQIRLEKKLLETQDLDGFKKWLLSNDINVIYVLATPTEETLELPNLPSNKGTNIIEVDTTITPSNMEVTYLGKK